MLGLISKKNIAMNVAYESFNVLKNYVTTCIDNEKLQCSNSCDPSYTPKEMLELLYNSSEYKKFVIDSLVLKKICRKISTIQTIVFLSLLTFLFMTLFFVKIIILKVIVSILLIILGVCFFMFFKTGKSYQQYYNETMSKILNMSVSEYTITVPYKKSSANCNFITKDFLNKHLDVHYDKYSTSYNCKFESDYEVGDEFELSLTDIVETKDKDGNIVKKEETVFDGFAVVSKNKQPLNVLNGSIIKIRDDHNITSALFEDTVNSMIQRKREFSFNSETLNKHLDCKIARTGFTSDVDQKMFEVTKIITPAFEEKLLFLDERYNSFNMNLSDNEFSFSVNMKKSSFQKFKSGELLKFSSAYKNRKHRTNIFLDVNFEYDKLYPILERLFLRKYFRIIYNYQMDSSRFNIYENEKITKYETEIKEIMDMPYKDFSEIHKDYVENLKNEISIKYNQLSSKEKI